MPFGTEVGLGPGDIVFDEDQAPLPEKGAQRPPLFGPCLLWQNGRPPATAYLLLRYASLCEQTDRQTHRNTSHSLRGEVIIQLVKIGRARE